MFCRLTSLFIFFCCLCRYSFCDCFYIFDVGQGNCQLAVFEDEKIGIMYDCGSSSVQEAAKISALKNEEWDLESEQQINKDELLSEKGTDTNKISKERQNCKRMSGNFNQQKIPPEKTNKKSEPVRKKMGGHIQKIIADHELNYLFIIFSHPDEDHINLIPHILENLEISGKVWVLCEGDWFCKEQDNEEKDKKTKKGKTWVLEVLRKKENTRIEFPFYWGGLLDINGEQLTYERVLSAFKTEKEVDEVFKLREEKDVIPALKYETLYEFVKEEGKIWPEEEKRVLENIKIAHINFPFKDVNSQSTIVKIKMGKLGMQFFLTGDASNETFSKIVETKKDFFKKDKDYISFVMLPHHGSIENKTNWLFKLFNPDIIGVSAGNGVKYRHPDKTLVDWITEQKYDGKVHLKDGFESMIMYQEGEEDGFLFENSFGKMPFICTNLLGDIKIYKDESQNPAFLIKFSPIFKDKDGVSYKVDISKHADVPEFSNTEYEDRSIQKAPNGKYYLCLKYKFEVKDEKGKKHHIETKYLYYRAKKLKNNASTVVNSKRQ